MCGSGARARASRRCSTAQCPSRWLAQAQQSSSAVRWAAPPLCSLQSGRRASPRRNRPAMRSGSRPRKCPHPAARAACQSPPFRLLSGSHQETARRPSTWYQRSIAFRRQELQLQRRPKTRREVGAEEGTQCAGSQPHASCGARRAARSVATCVEPLRFSEESPRGL